MKRVAIRSSLKGFFPDDSGATAIEYGLVAVIISISIIAAVEAIGSGSVLGYFAAVIDAFVGLL